MYQGLEAKLHDEFWRADEAGMREEVLVRRVLDESPGRALELGCGSGRLLIPLLKAGYSIEGLDNSEEMVRLCHMHMEKAEVATRIHLQSMEVMDLGHHLFQTVIVPGFSFQLLPGHGEFAECLRRIRRHLRSGGYLYFSVFLPWAEIHRELPEDEWYSDQSLVLKNGDRASIHTAYQLDVINQRLFREHRYEVHNSGGHLVEAQQTCMNLCFYWPNELKLLLKLAGYEVLGQYYEFEVEQGGELEYPACVSFICRVLKPELCEVAD